MNTRTQFFGVSLINKKLLNWNMAKSDDDYLTDILNLADGIESKIEDLGTVYRFANQILNICGKLANKAIAKDIRAEALKIVSTPDQAEIRAALEAIRNIISAPKLLPPGKEKMKACFDIKNILKTNRYLNDCMAYASEGNIPACETRIQTFPCTPTLHGIIGYGKWAGYYHARLTYNLRIMYLWSEEAKTITYVAIITKNELDKS